MTVNESEMIFDESVNFRESSRTFTKIVKKLLTQKLFSHLFKLRIKLRFS